jgi:hypothetical protein
MQIPRLQCHSKLCVSHTCMYISLEWYLVFMCRVKLKLPPILVKLWAKEFANFFFWNVNIFKGLDILTKAFKPLLFHKVLQVYFVLLRNINKESINRFQKQNTQRLLMKLNHLVNTICNEIVMCIVVYVLNPQSFAIFLKYIHILAWPWWMDNVSNDKFVETFN